MNTAADLVERSVSETLTLRFPGHSTGRRYAPTTRSSGACESFVGGPVSLERRASISGCTRHVCLPKVLAPENVEDRLAGGDQIVGDDPSVASPPHCLRANDRCSGRGRKSPCRLRLINPQVCSGRPAGRPRRPPNVRRCPAVTQGSPWFRLAGPGLPT
jgi:hypothetical protein